MCPETAEPLERSRCGGSLYLLICIKPLDAFTSGAERLQSKLVQTFPRWKLWPAPPMWPGAVNDSPLAPSSVFALLRCYIAPGSLA